MPSPNHGERKDGQRPDMILLHYTGMPDAQAALELLRALGSEVSAHYFVFEDGRIIQLVQESRRAWHAGRAVWAGETDINSCSIGIEIANPGHELRLSRFSQAPNRGRDRALPQHPDPQYDSARARPGPFRRRAVRASRIRAKNSPGARSTIRESAIGSSRRRSRRKARCSRSATAATQSLRCRSNFATTATGSRSAAL